MDIHLLQSVVDLAPDAIILVDPGGRIALANRQTERMFGYAPEDLLGKTVEYLVPDRFRASHIGHQAAYHAHPATRPMGNGLELFALCQDGRELPVEISLGPIPTEEGTFVTAIIRDISERRALEAARRRSDERYRLLAEQARDIIYRVRLVPGPPRIEYMSPAARPLTGYLPEDHYADPDLFVEMAEPEHRSLMQRLMSDPEALPNPFLVRIRKRDGSIAWHEQQFTVVRDTAGRAVAIEGIARDTTQRVRADEDRQRLMAQAELQHDRERIARDLHDGVMQAIYAVGLTLLEARTAVADVSPSSAASIDEAVQELRQVIDDIRRYVMSLPLDRLGAGIPALLDRLLDDVRTDAAIHTELTIPERMPVLSEQETLAMYHIAKEALTNARKHAQASRVELRLAADSGRLVLEVRDNGTGFDITKQFQQEHLGLRNMRERAEEIDGVIEVESVPGTGTLIRFSLPVPP